MNDEERRRRAAILAITAKYLRYVDEHKTDDGFSTEGAGTVQQLREAASNARLIVKTATGLDLTEERRRNLRSAGPLTN
jgi:hypothetical protein